MVAAKVTMLPQIRTPIEVLTQTHEVHSQIIPREVSDKPKIVPLWVFVVSACAGAIILMLLVYLLWKVGSIFSSLQTLVDWKSFRMGFGLTSY
jgi:hypothetical protein